jgi:mRNA interferase RelE/StbE
VKRIDEAILALRAEPRPSGSMKLRGGSELRRVVVGDYRIVYDVVDDPAVVTIARIRHRRDVYRDL